ncbi:MAG: Formamidopyrimidine-DNA glycosylase [Alphaproteobacteria bacterium ADurb.Bin438]|nr:MAG: Formamidopyrimidine-DNA glycosylase [Alphaproteobacteria bacterium ADurb.Bin438]
MPELPEVETIKTALNRALIGNSIKDVKINRKKIRLPIPDDFYLLAKSQEILTVERLAKYIVISLKNGEKIVIHLGMSGKIIISNNYEAKKHDHVVFELSNGTFITYNDARRFGFVSLMKCLDLSKLGIDALSDEFNAKYLKEKIKTKNQSIKKTLLDQEVVAGLGNIYVIESLFLSKINPLKSAKDLSSKEIEFLITNIKQVLKKAIKAGGTTLKDYRKADGSLGYFQNELFIYGKEGEKCPVCETIIKRVIEGGRSTFYCTKCQK